MRLRSPMAMWRVPEWPGDRDARGWPVILMYHSVSRWRTDPWGLRVSPRNFAEQMAVVRAHGDPMRLDQLTDAIDGGEIPRRGVIVTFDDGYADNVHTVLPVLKKHRIPATIFIASGYVGAQREFWWDELEYLLLKTTRLPNDLRLSIGDDVRQWTLNGDARFGLASQFRTRHWRAWHPNLPTVRHAIFNELRETLQSGRPEVRDSVLDQLRKWAGSNGIGRRAHRCVTLDQLRELAACDLVEIAAHTVHHPSLGAISVKHQQAEICRSKAWIEETLDRPVTSFAYPFGGKSDYTSDTIEILKGAGIRRACTTTPGHVTPEISPYRYPRHNVLDWNGAEFAARMSQWFA